MKRRLIIAMLLALALLASSCTTAVPSTTAVTTPNAATTAPAGTTQTGGTSSTAATAPASGSVYDTRADITFGLVCALTGTSKQVGEYVQNGAELAVAQINAKGGLLGKTLKLVIEDEIDSASTALAANTKILNDPRVSAVIGSVGSTNNLAVMPTVLEKKIPYFAGGSSAKIPLEKNPYVWQTRMTDDQSGLIMAKAAVNILKMKNPAIMYSTESFGTGLKDQTVAALKALGVTVKEANIYGYNAEEKQFNPILSKIDTSDVDGLLAFGLTAPSMLIATQVKAAGIDLPLLGSNSFSSIVVRTAAKEDSNGWYSVSDWTAEGQTGVGKDFADAYLAKYKVESDLVSVSAYDAVNLLAKAVTTAGSADPAKINEALKLIKNEAGAMTTYTYKDTHCLSTSQCLTVNKDLKSVLVEKITIN